MKTTGVLMLAMLLGACTSLDVRPIPASAKVDKICIRYNEEVNVEDLVPVVQDNLASHGIESVVFKDQTPSGCSFQLNYTADRWWDLGTYMVDANITVWKDSVLFGSAHYHLNGHGGFDLMKWEGTKAKLTPPMDKMLKAYPIKASSALPKSAPN
jgi:hypothetical protein